MHDAWQVGAFRAEWWYACRLPVNWKLAEEAFVEQYHVLQAHPQLRIPERYPARDPADFDPRTLVDGELQYLRTMCDGMDGMVHARDVEIAEHCRSGAAGRLPEAVPPGNEASTKRSTGTTASAAAPCPISTS